MLAFQNPQALVEKPRAIEHPSAIEKVCVGVKDVALY